MIGSGRRERGFWLIASEGLLVIGVGPAPGLFCRKGDASFRTPEKS